MSTNVFRLLFEKVVFVLFLSVVIDLLNCFIDGNDLKLRQLDNIADSVLLVWVDSTITSQFHLYFISSILCFVSYLVCFTVGVVSRLERLAHSQVFYSCNWLGFEVFGFFGWVLMKNNESVNVVKCLKPSGLIDWVNCRLCKGWVHILCPKKSRTEA